VQIPRSARAFWSSGGGTGEIRTAALPAPGQGEVVVRTLHSAVSRGTESLVFRGAVPPVEHERMRAPFQEGSFDGPVKYGYSNVGIVESGPPELLGRSVFCLYPHQTRYVVPCIVRPPAAARCAAAAGGAGRQPRDRDQRPVGCGTEHR
jgi:hypothetical protein